MTAILINIILWAIAARSTRHVCRPTIVCPVCIYFINLYGETIKIIKKNIFLNGVVEILHFNTWHNKHLFYSTKPTDKCNTDSKIEYIFDVVRKSAYVRMVIGKPTKLREGKECNSSVERVPLHYTSYTRERQFAGVNVIESIKKYIKSFPNVPPQV